MKLTVLTLLLLLSPVFGQQSDYNRIKADAERFYAEKSYARSYELYSQADGLNLSADEKRWVAFRLGDTLWRAEAGTETSDSTKFDQAREKLEALIKDVKREEDQDRVWVETQESLGDFWWARRNAQNWNEGWPHYQKAFDWWAAQRDVDTARSRYLQLFWKAVAPPWIEIYYANYYINYLPVEYFDNAVKIARDQNDVARAHYYLASRLRNQGELDERARVADELEAALKTGKTSDWYDDALYMFGEWMATTGNITQLETGEWRAQPDYVKALALFSRIVTEFRKGETRYYDDARNQIENITRASIGVYASNIFLPDSEVQLNLSWRNVGRIELNLYRADLETDVQFTNKDQSAGSWIGQINLAGHRPIRSWSKDTKDDGTHSPGQDLWRMDQHLPIGTYVIEAHSGNVTARDVVIVTDATLVVKTAGRQTLVYFCNAISGAPLPNATIKVWEKSYNPASQQWTWAHKSAISDKDGLAIFQSAESQNSNEFFASAESDGRTAFAVTNSYYYSPAEPSWRIYAFTDRPAYRPSETVQWKFLARKLQDSVYSTPANESITYEIRDPRGNKVKDANLTLNSFGSGWGNLELTETMPLGVYQVTFYDSGRNHTIGSATLFRLEEYKLPEFQVTVQTPEVDGHKKSFRLGEKVEVSINAEYYFGGAVSDASVEVVVYQNPFYHYWRPPQEYSWYYSDLSPQRYQYGGGRGQIVKRETLKTDAKGHASLVIESPRNAAQDLEYFIEARVTDSSRREILGSDTVRVTRQRYYVYPRAQHNLYRPNDKVAIDFKSIDANEQPASVTGQIKVTRDFYYEVWLDPSGREVTGDELRRIQADFAIRNQTMTGWRIKFRGYQHEDILNQSLKTDQAGEATLSFTPNREGYYRVSWTSPDKGGPLVRAETTVWVTTNRTTDLGYRGGAVELIIDKDTFHAGQPAPVMITTAIPDRYVLFSVEADDLYSYQLVHLTGTTKLLELQVTEKHVPNVFLNAAMVAERQLFLDSKQVIVPPVQHFLNVEVTSDRAQYRPREEGTLRITTRDQAGNPVAAEVALGLVDASVFYIQQEMAGDPRQFYFGSKRPMRSQIQSTFQQRLYAKLIEGANKELIDDVVLARQKDEESRDVRTLQSLSELRPSGTLRGNEVQVGAVNGPTDALRTADEVGGMRKEIISEQKIMMPSAAPKPEQAEPAVQVRNDFRSTVFWQPDVITGADGTATVKVNYPDSLTTWTATARAATTSDKFGIATSESRTKKPLIVRLEAPRFFVAGDLVTISAVINNNNNESMTVAPNLEAQGVVVTGLVENGKPVKGEVGPVNVPANGEARVDWLVSATTAGAVKLKVTARGPSDADAMEREFSAYEHGIAKLVVKSGKLRGDEVSVRLEIPKERKTESTRLMVQIAPSMAVTMLDALPYLIDYPYGCTEQTMSRFLPAAITAKTLKDRGLSPEAAMQKVFGGIEQDTASQTHPKGKHDLAELDRIVKEGLERLYNMQHGDGGWGWWKDDSTDRFMTAYVLWGFSLATDAGIKINPDAMTRAATYLNAQLVEDEANYDMQAWSLHALASYHATLSRTSTHSPTEFETKAFNNIWNNRDKLNAYTRALLALSAHNLGYSDKAQALIRNLENGVKLDRTPDISIVQRGVQESNASVMGTAHWGEDGIYYRWSDGGIEATSFALRAILAIDPQNKLIEPVTNWLIKNRRGAQWSNTRDTAITVLALNDYLRVSGEALPDIAYQLSVNGNPVVSKSLTAANALSAPSQFIIDNRYLRDGQNEIVLQRQRGSGPLYFSAQASFFSLEEPVKAAGNEIFVRREYYKLVGHPTLLKGYVYERVPLKDGETVESGDRVEVVISVEAKNNYEYLLFEDLKPAGLEAVQVRSGESLAARELKSGALDRRYAATGPTDAPKAFAHTANSADLYTGRTSYVYQELRDRKVALFISKLPQGVWEIRYTLRAEAPGSFHALPVLGQAMYVPEIRCNDAELRIRVVDKLPDR